MTRPATLEELMARDRREFVRDLVIVESFCGLLLVVVYFFA